MSDHIQRGVVLKSQPGGQVRTKTLWTTRPRPVIEGIRDERVSGEGSVFCREEKSKPENEEREGAGENNPLSKQHRF